MLKFEINKLVYLRDIGICPHPENSLEAHMWNYEDGKRLKLLALERYIIILDYLRKTNQLIINR